MPLFITFLTKELLLGGTDIRSHWYRVREVWIIYPSRDFTPSYNRRNVQTSEYSLNYCPWQNNGCSVPNTYGHYRLFCKIIDFPFHMLSMQTKALYNTGENRYLQTFVWLKILHKYSAVLVWDREVTREFGMRKWRENEERIVNRHFFPERHRISGFLFYWKYDKIGNAATWKRMRAGPRTVKLIFYGLSCLQ